MLTRRGRTAIIERMSRNAWIDCGGDIYVLDIPKYGYIKVERAPEEDEASKSPALSSFGESGS
jgi:ATP-dependent helicase IRC3